MNGLHPLSNTQKLLQVFNALIAGAQTYEDCENKLARLKDVIGETDKSAGALLKDKKLILAVIEKGMLNARTQGPLN